MRWSVCPKLPMRDVKVTRHYYCQILGFEVMGTAPDGSYLMVQKNQIELHFFRHLSLNPSENDGQVYIRVEDIDAYYQSLIERKIAIHPSGKLEQKPWGQREFALLDPDHNLLTFGQSI